MEQNIMGSKTLLIVESPAKANTLKQYLGKDFQVLASYGHIRDLIKRSGAIDIDDNYACSYETLSQSTKHIQDIKKALKTVDRMLIATDPDREGEAIAWHLNEILKKGSALKNKEVHRIVFYQITKKAVLEAIEKCREIDMNLVNAQQARRVLDYLVGFNLSPLLWRKIRPGLSAGRVQSPALRMIVERENEIDAFNPEEYWSIVAQCTEENIDFSAKLTHFKDDKIGPKDIKNEKMSATITTELLESAKSKLTVSNIETKNKNRNPQAPFTTSTLQQEASSRIRFGASKTMRTAQELYEGIQLKDGKTGLITYMRTDSVNLASEAIDDIRNLITQYYSADDVPEKPRMYKTKSKNAQEAHEAIRPTDAFKTPESIKPYLTPDQFKLYELIWRRAIASQMNSAILAQTRIDLTCDNGQFRASGTIVIKPHFLKVYEDISEESTSPEQAQLPKLKKGSSINLLDIVQKQHFTEPPPRYSEASLVKALEEHGIGRPSTFTSIISTLLKREYVELEKRRFHPTEIGKVVSKFLCNYFNKCIDYGFTAQLEDQLDEISRGETDWIPIVDKYWKPLDKDIKLTQENVKRSDVTQEIIEESCPECKKPLCNKLGKASRFIGCTGFPDCRYTRSLETDNSDEGPQKPDIKIDHNCPKCDAELQVKNGRFGPFIGCSSYPKCKHIENIANPNENNTSCPKCQDGQLQQRRTRKGKPFWGCNSYPTCQYALWNEPVEKECTACQWPIMMNKASKKAGQYHECPECKAKEPIEDDTTDS